MRKSSYVHISILAIALCVLAGSLFRHPGINPSAVNPAPVQSHDGNVLTVPGGTTDDTSALQTALTQVPPGGKIQLIPGVVYTFRQPLAVYGKPFTLDAENAVMVYSGPDGIAALTLGYASSDPNAARTADFHYIIRGLRLRTTLPRGNNSAAGLCWQNVYAGHIEGLAISGFGEGLQIIGDGTGCTYGSYSFREMVDNAVQIHVIAKNGGYVSESVFSGPGHFGFNRIFVGQACCHVRTETDGTAHTAIGGLRFISCSFEGQDSFCLAADVQQGQWFSWLGCRFETVTKDKMPVNLALGVNHSVLLGSTAPMVSWVDANAITAGNLFMPEWVDASAP